MSLLRSGVLLALLAAGCGGAGTARAAADAPNVLLITIGDLRADRLGLMAHGKSTSPELDAFAAGAVVFADAEASAPCTLPTLASLLTGESPSTHACEEAGCVLDGSFTTLAEHLLAAGYDTACVVGDVLATARHGLHQGFVHVDESSVYPEIDPAEASSAQVISDKGIRFLEQKEAAADGVPWFLWLHYVDPEPEYLAHGQPAAGLAPADDRTGVPLGDAYDGEVAYTDQHVGRLLARLAQGGFASRTVVVVLADHGVELSPRDEPELPRLSPGLLHIPLLVRAPGVAPRRVGDLVRQIDVLPTVLELAGAPLPAGIPGRSLVPLLSGRTLEPAPALAELHDGPWSAESLRFGRFRLLRNAPDASFVLHDLAADPGEEVDVSARYPKELAEGQHELERELEVARGRAVRAGGRAGPSAAARRADPSSAGSAAHRDPAEKNL